MNELIRTSRREFLKLAGALSALLLIPSILKLPALERYAGEKLFRRNLKNFHSYPESARVIGRRYLELYPEEKSVEKMVGRLEKDHRWQKIELFSSDKNDFARLVRKPL